MAKRKQEDFDLVYINERSAPENLNKKTFSIHDLKNLKAKTEAQSQFFDAYFSRQMPIIAQIGSAGTGKTVVALYAALNDILDNRTDYEKIVIIRSSVQARNIGFLPGTEEEKNEVYEAPYAALCDELLKYKTNNYKNLKALNLVSFENTSFLRGITFNNTVVILDECQNMTYHELSTVITRLGENSRIILCGDMKQVDMNRKDDQSGLEQLIRVFDKMSDDCVEVVSYRPEHIVRSGLVKEFLLAEERA